MAKGARGNKNVSVVGGGKTSAPVKLSPQEQLVGTRVSDAGITYNNVEQKLGLQDLSTAQKNTLVNMFGGMSENDYSYDENRTPYEIQMMKITQPFRDNEIAPSNIVSVLVVTGGNTGRTVVDMFDVRTRQFLIGKNGGVYTYSSNHKRKAVSNFEVRHGKLE